MRSEDVFNQQLFIEQLLGARPFARDMAVTRTASAQWGRQRCPQTVISPDRQSWEGNLGTDQAWGSRGFGRKGYWS